MAQEAERWMAQEAIPIIHPWLGEISRILTHEMRFNFQVPDGFNTGEEIEFECFEEYPLLRRVFSCFLGRVQSNDNEHFSRLQFFSIDMIYNVDTPHLNQMRAIYTRFHQSVEVAQGLREWSRFIDFDHDWHWHESAYFFSPEETRTKFNADTAAFFTLTLPSGHYYLEKYRYIDVFMLQKNGRGFVTLVSFYTETAKQNIDWYRQQLWGSLRWYED